MIKKIIDYVERVSAEELENGQVIIVSEGEEIYYASNIEDEKDAAKVAAAFIRLLAETVIYDSGASNLEELIDVIEGIKEALHRSVMMGLIDALAEEEEQNTSMMN